MGSTMNEDEDGTGPVQKSHLERGESYCNQNTEESKNHHKKC